MPRTIDLTGMIENEMWDYSCIDMAGAVFPPISIDRIASIEENGYDAHAYRLTSLTGTYLETAAHLIPGRPTVDQIPVDHFIRPARLLRLPVVEPSARINRKDLQPYSPDIKPGDALLIDTGWGELWNRPEYVTHSPHFDLSALQWLLDLPFSILGLDLPCADENAEILHPLFQKGMLMVAPLVHLRQIQIPHGMFIALPLRIRGVCSTPCRAVFIEGD